MIQNRPELSSVPSQLNPYPADAVSLYEESGRMNSQPQRWLRGLMSRFEVPVSELLKVILKLNSVLQISTIDGNRIGSDLTDSSDEAEGLIV